VTVGRFSENSPLVIDYNVCAIDYTVIILRVMTFEFEFQEFIAGNRLQTYMVIDYMFKIQIQNPFQWLFFILPFW